MAKKIGSQRPSRSFTLPYSETHGQRAIDAYNSSGRTAQEWQELLVYDILAVDDEDQWVHSKFGLAVPRQNGKNEVVAIVELDGLKKGMRTLHTAHRVQTSSAAARRLAAILDGMGYQEVQRVKAGKTYDKHYTYAKQVGMEKITLLCEGGGSVDFRTRSAKGGLGESYDRLIVDEAQEYRDDEESALKYVIAASACPQTIMLGTPPTMVSSGTVFPKVRKQALAGEAECTGWAEWSVPELTDPHDRDAWYITNPSLGTLLKERTIASEIGPDTVDFNIQRLGHWLSYSQKSEISEAEWDGLKVEQLPELKGKLHVGIKFGFDGGSVSMAIAAKTKKDDQIFVEVIDCKPIRAGNAWIIDFLKDAAVADIIIDGQSGQNLLAKEMKEAGKLKEPILPTVKDVITANTAFMQMIASDKLRHAGQPSLRQVATNCEKRAIGSNGGYGFRAIVEGNEIALLDSVILAAWKCSEAKTTKKKTRFGY